MKKLISKLKDKSRRGFTVAEVVVALTIIVLVSGASVLTFAVQARVEAKTAQTFEATNIAENAIECFIYAGGDAEAEAFESAFEKAFNENNGYTLTEIEANKEYTVTKGGVTATITIENNEIEITVVNPNNENILSKAITVN